MTVIDRKTGWLSEAFQYRFREIMLHAAAREGLFCPAYCLMPDHLHLLWLGLRRDTDQRNGMSFLRTHLKPLLSPYKFQPQAYDHVLREEERQRNAFAKICFYILANPVRAKLIKESERWSFCGAVIPGYPKLHPLDEDFCRCFGDYILNPASPMLANESCRHEIDRRSRRKEALIHLSSQPPEESSQPFNQSLATSTPSLKW
jgi:REP element-mobilizing transposase RayT